jgi:hypothetical protein
VEEQLEEELEEGSRIRHWMEQLRTWTGIEGLVYLAISCFFIADCESLVDVPDDEGNTVIQLFFMRLFVSKLNKKQSQAIEKFILNLVKNQRKDKNSEKRELVQCPDILSPAHSLGSCPRPRHGPSSSGTDSAKGSPDVEEI